MECLTLALNKTASVAYQGKVKEEWSKVTKWFQANDRNGDWIGTGRTKANINYMLNVLKDWEVSKDEWIVKELKKQRSAM